VDIFRYKYVYVSMCVIYLNVKINTKCNGKVLVDSILFFKTNILVDFL